MPCRANDRPTPSFRRKPESILLLLVIPAQAGIQEPLAWLGLAWLGLAWLGLAWLGLAWLGLAWLWLSAKANNRDVPGPEGRRAWMHAVFRPSQDGESENPRDDETIGLPCRGSAFLLVTFLWQDKEKLPAASGAEAFAPDGKPPQERRPWIPASAGMTGKGHGNNNSNSKDSSSGNSAAAAAKCRNKVAGFPPTRE